MLVQIVKELNYRRWIVVFTAHAPYKPTDPQQNFYAGLSAPFYIGAKLVRLI